jgi:hypothetical protein
MYRSMGSEPKKPIEQMLEVLAKARRAEFGDDPKMPNPMRARLHEEIARAGAADEENVELRESWLTRFWPRVTVAAALATLIVLVPAIWWNQKRPSSAPADVAARDRAAAGGNGPNPAVATENILAKAPSVSATKPTVNLADNSQIKIEPAATPASEAEALKSVTKGFGDKEITSAKIRAAPAAAAAAGVDSKTKSETIAGVAPPVAQPSSAGGLATTQQFSQQSALQSFRNNAQVSRAANVLNTFQVQQEGSEIRVLDADGSTYTGKIEQLAKGVELDSRITARGYAAKQTRTDAAQAGEGESAAPQSYFRTTGYNVSLKKTLVFEGNYAASATQLPAKATTNDRDRAESTRDGARIVGTVRVNGEAPVEVDAIAETSEGAATKKSDK